MPFTPPLLSSLVDVCSRIRHVLGASVSRLIWGPWTRRVLPLLSVCFLASPSQAEEPAAGRLQRFPRPGEWGCYRRDGSQQARSPMAGRISTPDIAWQHFVGSVEALIEVSPGSNEQRIDVPNAATAAKTWQFDGQRWGTQAPSALIAGRRQAVARTANQTYADLRPDIPGLEKIVFESGFRGSGAGGQWPTSGAEAFAWQQGGWQSFWKMPPMELLFTANPVVADFAADGAVEIAFVPWRDLVILDGRTGQRRAACRFTSGRSYGFLGTYDLDRDGAMEFLVMADFAKHVEVLGYRGGELMLLWKRDIELDISNPQKTMRVNIDPAADVDGDGILEVMLNLCNDKGDARWHTLVLDGLTGAVEADLADEHLESVADVDGDGIAELLTVATKQAGIPAFGDVRIWALQGGTPRKMWERPRAAWQTWQRPMPAHVNTQATDGRKDVLWHQAGGRFAVVLRELADSGAILLKHAAWENGGLRLLSAIQGPDLHALGLDAEGAMLVRCETRPGAATQLQLTSGPARVLALRQAGMFASPPVVVRDGPGKRAVIVQGRGERLLAFSPPKERRPASELWRVRGRGQSDNWHGQLARLGPVSAALQGDDQRHLLYATASSNGCARIVAMAMDGREFWYHDFPRIPGAAPAWNVGGLILWQAGHFTDPLRMDVLVTVRRSMMHSEESVLLSGTDGRRLWHRRRALANRGVGGTPFALADCTGDGLEDAVSLHPNVFYALNGRTGKNVCGRVVEYWGLPVIGDFLNNGSTSVFFGTTRGSATALLNTDGSSVWWDARGASPKCLPAFGDFSGAGRSQTVGLGYSDGIRCYDTASGRVDWRLALPTSAHVVGTASADIDSDGRDEVLFTAANTLWCVGYGPDTGTASVEWQQQFPATVGPPTIADPDGDASVEVLVMGSDGVVYCVDEGQE